MDRWHATRAGALWHSSIGKKAVMAITGAALLLYVVVHMLSNLKFFLGPESLDGYGHWLRSIAAGALGYEGFVWMVRVGLLACVILHGVAAVQLARRARRARPDRYRTRTRVADGYAVRTMRWGGVILALFIVYHILDLTTGTLNPHGVHGEIHANVRADFDRWYVVLAYTVSVVALGFHIRHGLWSALQSLGAAGREQRTLRRIALGGAVFVCAGFLSIPFAVITGLS
ncbi:succinate dehydrogenase cytochrome b subunit [Herbihabitans rhizosphaerae]|uniref:succinate dehydrogenase cytochrome b subunit n=1 Tax=Herbihabitans rhizosphaerae TaxID=1872711 RepID=UPI0030FE7716